MAGLIYPLTADHINHYGYRVKVPAVALAQPKEYTSQEMEPIFLPFNATDVTVTRLSINRLMEISQTKTRFHIIDPEDVVEVFHMIDKYLMSMEGRILGGEIVVIEYCRKLLEFRELFYRKHFLVTLNKNPRFKETYRTRTGTLQRILSLFSTIPGAMPGMQDPIEALAIPPVKLPTPDTAPVAVSTQSQTAMASMGFTQDPNTSRDTIMTYDTGA